MALTAPQLASVVMVANSAESGTPKRVSLPSMLPPDCCAVTCWVTPCSAGFGCDSAQKAVVNPAANKIDMQANTAHPWPREPVIRPSVTVSPAPIQKIRNISMKLLSGVGFSKGCALLALKNPTPLVPSSLIASCEATGPCAMVCTCPCTVWAIVYGCRF